MRRHHRSVLALLAGLALLLTACGGGEGPTLASEKTPRLRAAFSARLAAVRGAQ